MEICGSGKEKMSEKERKRYEEVSVPLAQLVKRVSSENTFTDTNVYLECILKRYFSQKLTHPLISNMYDFLSVERKRRNFEVCW